MDAAHSEITEDNSIRRGINAPELLHDIAGLISA